MVHLRYAVHMKKQTPKQSIGIRLKPELLAEVREWAGEKGLPVGMVLRLLCEWAWRKYRPFGGKP